MVLAWWRKKIFTFNEDCGYFWAWKWLFFSSSGCIEEQLMVPFPHMHPNPKRVGWTLGRAFSFSNLTNSSKNKWKSNFEQNWKKKSHEIETFFSGWKTFAIRRRWLMFHYKFLIWLRLWKASEFVESVQEWADPLFIVTERVKLFLVDQQP